MAKRLRAMGQSNYAKGFTVACHEQVLDLPLRWKRPRLIFVNSMSDLFHDAVPLDSIHEVFKVMRRANHHVFQVLTKRAERLAQLSPILDWPENVWTGVTVERSDFKRRIDSLRMTGAAVKLLSLEPLLDDLGELDLTGIDWVIVGGESGPGARPMQAEWVRAIRDQCLQRQAPVSQAVSRTSRRSPMASFVSVPIQLSLDSVDMPDPFVVRGKRGDSSNH